METLELQRKHDRTEAEVEALRERYSGTFTNTMGHMVKSKGGIWTKEQTSFPETSHNIVTNEGLDHVLNVQLNALTNLLVWYLTGFTDNITPLSSHDYAADGVTELTTTNVAEAVRETYNANAASGQSIDNVAGPVAQYIADESFTFWGAMLKAGNSAFTDATDDAVHILWSSSLLGSSKSMVALDTIDLTYTFTSADA
jgi:hypothetical protein